VSAPELVWTVVDKRVMSWPSGNTNRGPVTVPTECTYKERERES
jgi:hypothetical protein